MDDRYFRGETGWRLMAPAELLAHRAECDRLVGLVVVLALALAEKSPRTDPRRSLP